MNGNPSTADLLEPTLRYRIQKPGGLLRIDLERQLRRPHVSCALASLFRP